MSGAFIGACATGNRIVWDVDNLTGIGGFPVTSTGNPTVISTPYGDALEFNPAIEADPAVGTGDRIQVQGNPLGADTEFTIEMIFNPYASTASLQPRVFHICHPDSAASGVRTMTMETRSSDAWYGDFFIKSINASGIMDAAKTHPTGQWTHMAMTYKSGVINGYVNGLLDVTYPSTTTVYTGLPSNAEVSLGGRMQGKYYFRGAIRQLIFTPKALEPADFSYNGASKVINAKSPLIIAGFGLHQNYPNPVSTGCIIPLLLQKRQSVQLELFNARGEKVKTLLSGEVGEGTHDVVVTTGDLTSGMYCYTIRMANGVKQTRLMQILNEKR
jgi:hypothetical protein